MGSKSMPIKLLTLFFFYNCHGALVAPLNQLEWLIGQWKSEFGGKIVWPTVPTMTYGENLTIQQAPLSYGTGYHFLNFTSRAWSHSTGDIFLDTYGYITVDHDGNVTMLSTGNNGFSAYETGKVSHGLLQTRPDNLGRISIAREIPVEDLYRQFLLIDENSMEQVLLMRTSQHPSAGLLEHARVVYERMKPENEEKVKVKPADPLQSKAQ